MNQEQRKRLQEALDIVSAIAEEEREKYDNLSEYFPDSERTERIGEIAGNLDEAVSYIEEAMEEY